MSDKYTTITADYIGREVWIENPDCDLVAISYGRLLEAENDEAIWPSTSDLSGPHMLYFGFNDQRDSSDPIVELAEPIILEYIKDDPTRLVKIYRVVK